METAEMDDILDKMDVFIEKAPESSVTIIEPSDNDSEKENLFTESIEDFSTAPIVFEEAAARMLNKVEELFDLSTKYDRNVPQYLECCSWLERGIKALGSAALTKICLEKRNFEFTLLDQLSTQKLYEMASFNFRKIDAALSSALEGKKETAYDLFRIQYRYYLLLDRLKATETKIYQINNGFLSDTEIVKHALMLSKESWNERSAKRQVKPSVFRRTTAFPVLGNAIREAEWGFHRKKEEKKPVLSHFGPDGLPMTHDKYPVRGNELEAKLQKQADDTAKREEEKMISETCNSMLASAGKDNRTPENGNKYANMSAAEIWNALFAMRAERNRKIPPDRA